MFEWENWTLRTIDTGGMDELVLMSIGRREDDVRLKAIVDFSVVGRMTSDEAKSFLGDVIKRLEETACQR